MQISQSVLLMILLTFIVSCAGDDERDIDIIDQGTDKTQSTDSASDSDSKTDPNSDSNADDFNCSDEAKLVYVIDTKTKLWKFDPPNKKLHLVGQISCESKGSPFSMAVARDDTAYVQFWNGNRCTALNAVSIFDANCDAGATAFDCHNSAGFKNFGMGFATDGPDAEEETLYIGQWGNETSQIASVEKNTWQINPIGPLSDSPELTGNQKGELWAYFARATPPRIAQINKETGIESNVIYLKEFINVPTWAFAFAYWGGDFYLFRSGQGEYSTVHKIHGDSSETEVWMSPEATGIVIVGAGVSTCAPTIIE